MMKFMIMFIFSQNNFLSPLLMTSLQWNPNWWLECEAAAQCEQLAALAEKPTDDAFGEPVFASSLSPGDHGVEWIHMQHF